MNIFFLLRNWNDDLIRWTKSFVYGMLFVALWTSWTYFIDWSLQHVRISIITHQVTIVKIVLLISNQCTSNRIVFVVCHHSEVTDILSKYDYFKQNSYRTIPRVSKIKKKQFIPAFMAMIGLNVAHISNFVFQKPFRDHTLDGGFRFFISFRISTSSNILTSVRIFFLKWQKNII